MFLYSKYFIFPLNVKKYFFNFCIKKKKDEFYQITGGRLLLSPSWSSDLIIDRVIVTSFDCFSCSCSCSCCCSARVTRTGQQQCTDVTFTLFIPTSVFCLCVYVLDLLSAAVCNFMVLYWERSRHSVSHFYWAWHQRLQYLLICFTFLLFYQMGSVYSSREREFNMTAVN